MRSTANRNSGKKILAVLVAISIIAACTDTGVFRERARPGGPVVHMVSTQQQFDALAEMVLEHLERGEPEPGAGRAEPLASTGTGPGTRRRRD